MDPTFETEFVVTAIRDSASLTGHLISPQGIPIMGRSACYRTAVPVPVIAASLLDGPAERTGRALRALDAVWRYFVAHGSVSDGALTQGYFGNDPRVVDYYTGTGSCHWGLRSLVLGFLHRPDEPFWTGPQIPLPVEVADYRLEYPKLGWTVEGHHASGEIVIEIPANAAEIQDLEPYTWIDRAIETMVRKPHQPSNYSAKYGSMRYSSAEPFAATLRP